MRRVAIAVRPYSGELRRRVFELLSGLRIEVLAPPELDSSATNGAVVEYLRGHRPDLLLVPFHVVRSGVDRTTGIEALRRIREELPELKRVPALMPVSLFARLAFERAWSQTPLEGVRPLHEEELTNEALRDELIRFLRAGLNGGASSAA